jgi:hypothetical protein
MNEKEEKSKHTFLERPFLEHPFLELQLFGIRAKALLEINSWEHINWNGAKIDLWSHSQTEAQTHAKI